MSIGQPCKHCTHGKMRPIHFSWAQAVVLCDNYKCKSILDAAPSECIVHKDILFGANQQFSGLDLQTLLNDGSGCSGNGGSSSGGAYSEARSSLPSPAQSRKSGTDEEVELLLKRSCNALSFKGPINISSESSGSGSHAQTSSGTRDTHTDYSKYDRFFELLGNLDLEVPATQPMITESHAEPTFTETGLDVVTTELEGWMKGFEFPSFDTDNSSSVSSGACQQPPNEVLSGVSLSASQHLSDAAVRSASGTRTTLQAPCIPSQRSAFATVEASNEEPVSFINNEQNSSVSSFSCHSSSSGEKDTFEYLIQQDESACLSATVVNEFVRENMTAFPTRFMSPTASAASEDSGYNEEEGKASSSSEIVVGEENLKGSSKPVHSSLKSVNNVTKGIPVKQSHQSHFEKLIQGSLDWPAMSDVQSLTVLPAIVTTENTLTEAPPQPSTLPSVPSTSTSEQICASQDESEKMCISTDHLDGGSQNVSGPCEDNECSAVLLENCHDRLAEASHGVTTPEHLDACVTPQPYEVAASEGSSHARLSEPKDVSESDGNNEVSEDGPSTATACSRKERNKGRGPEESRHRKCRSLRDRSKGKDVSEDQLAAGRVSGRNRGREKTTGRKPRRRKSKISRVKDSEEDKQYVPSKRPCNRKQPERLRNTRKGRSRSARRKLSSRESHSPSSSGRKLSAKKDALELHEKDGENLTTPAWQLPEGRLSQLSRRATTKLSPRKLHRGHVNRDPWSVLDLYLEEVEIEIIVENQGKATHDPDKATQCDAQLKELLSLFVKKQSESDQSNLSTSDTAPTLPTKVCSEAPSEKEPGNSPLQGESTRGHESEGNNLTRDSHQDVKASEQQQTQNSAPAKTSEKELVDADKIEEKDVITDTFHELPCGENISQFDVIDKSIASTNMGQEDSQPLDKVCSDRENLSTQEDVYSGENESVPKLQVDTNSLLSEGAVCVKGQLVSDTFEGVCTSSLEKDDEEKIISSGQETHLSVKQSSDKPQNVLGSELVKTGNSESNVESCATENTQSLSSNSNQSCAGKSAFASTSRQCTDESAFASTSRQCTDESAVASTSRQCTDESAVASTSRQCTDDFDSALNFLEMSKYESPWFEKVCDKRLPSESEKIRTEKLNVGGPVVKVGPAGDNTDTPSLDASPTSSPETTSQYFLNPPKFGPVRNWIGCEDDTSLTGCDFCSQENLQETIPPSRCSGVKVKGSMSSGVKVKGSSSKYFQSLLKDLDFDEKFLQCPVTEPPSETFCEHLKSPDFFGETASDYPPHIEEPETAEYISDFIYKDYLGINGVSKSCVQAWSQPLSGTETPANTQVPHVPSPSNIAQVPITSVTTNIASCKVSSVERKTSLGRKVVIIPKTSKVRYLLNQSSGSHSFLGGSVPRPELSSESLGLQSSVVGSSGEVNVGGKKADHLSEFIKHSERETDIAKRSIKERSGCAFEMADTLHPVEVRNQEHLSNAEHVRGDLKSEQMSALSDSSRDFVREESRVDVFLKNEPVCASVTAKTTETPSSNTVSLQQTSSCHCSAKTSDNSKNCDCYSGNLKDKTEISTYCTEQTGSQLNSLSDSDDDDDCEIPLLSLDSDGELQITIPETEDLASQEKKGYCIASGKDMGDDVAVDKCIESEEIIKDSFSLKIKEPETALARTVTLGQKRKAPDQDESNKKPKLLDTSAEMEDKESIQKHDNHSQAFSNSQRGLLMCGILDASIVHDEHCCSSLHRDFQEFLPRTENKETTHKTGKTYAVPSKQCSSSDHKCTDEGINDAPRFCDGGDGADNDYSVCSDAKDTTTHTPHGRTGSNYDPKFGFVVASPQYDSSSCLSVEKEASDLDFFHTGFLAPLISPIDSHVVVADASQEEKDVVPCTLKDTRGGVDASVKEHVAEEECQQNKLNDEMAHNASEGSFITNTGDNLKEENISTPKLSNIPSTSNVSSANTTQSTTSCQARPLKAGLDKVIFTNMGLNNCNKSQSTSENFLNFSTLGKTIVLLKSSQPHPTVSSHYSVASNMTSLLTNSVSLPLVSSQASPKMNDGAEKQHIPGATGHHSLMIPSCHSSKNKALQPWPMTPSSLAQSGTTVNQVMTSDSHKQTSLIDYQITANPTTTTTVLPALAANQAYSLPVLAQSSHSVSMSSIGSVGMSALSGNTTVSGVVRAASTPLYLNPLKPNQIILNEQVRKNLESFLGDVHVEEAGGNEEGSSMLKKVKLGSKGSFYLRPTPALKNAISEMRKKENTEDKEEEATSSCYLTFPDGGTIPHPMSLPPTVRTVPTSEVKVIKHKRKRRKRKIRKRDMKKMLKERVDKLLECSKNNEIPKVMVIYTMGSFHICEIDVTDGR